MDQNQKKINLAFPNSNQIGTALIRNPDISLSNANSNLVEVIAY